MVSESLRMPCPLPESGLYGKNSKIRFMRISQLRRVAARASLLRDQTTTRIMALVHGEITIGGEYCDLSVFPSLDRGSHITLRPSQTGWEWAEAGSTQWTTLAADSLLGTKDLGLTARWGSYDDFS